MTPSLTLTDRLRGALIGLAVGDAVGAPIEFKRPGTFTPLTDMTGGGTWGLAPGHWTDDTSLALCLADSLVASGDFDPGDQMRRYVRWWQEGYLSSTGVNFDIGNTTRAALDRFLRTGEPYAGSTSGSSAGNGSLMRLAPVPIFFVHDHELALRRCADSSRTTHGTPDAVDACRYFGGLLLGAFGGVPREELLAPFYSPIQGYWEEHPLSPAVAEVASGSFARENPPRIRGAGYVVASLEAALWAPHNTDDFRSGCLAAANLGDDADTTAAVFGQIGGALYGESGIPVAWRERLAMPETIEGLLQGLLAGPAR